MTTEPEKTTPDPRDVMAAHRITIESVFVPFSQSRSNEQDTPNLNWKVTIKRDGHEVLTTDYQAGLAHAPGYRTKHAPLHFVPRNYKSRRPGGGYDYRAATPSEARDQFRDALAAAECESGFPMRLSRLGYAGQKAKFEKIGRRPGKPDSGHAIEPNPADVLYCLIMDSAVLDFSGFEEWAGDFGFDTDSVRANKIYRACLETALQMRAGLGNDTLQELRAAFLDY